MDILALMYVLNVNEALDWEIERTNRSQISWILRAPEKIDPNKATGNWCQDDGTKTRCGYKSRQLCEFNNWLDHEFPCRKKSPTTQ